VARKFRVSPFLGHELRHTSRKSRSYTRRYTCSMQLEIKQREKMKRRRALQLMLFLKVSLIIGLVAGCEVASRIWKIPFLWAVFCTGHSLQVCRGKICGVQKAHTNHFEVRRRDMRCKKSFGGGRFTKVPFLSQFSFPNDVPYRTTVIFPSQFRWIMAVYEYTSAR